MQKISLLLAMTFVAVSAAPASAAEWKIDSKHSQANFKVRHMMVSNVNGTMSGIKGTADYDGKNVNSLKVNAEIDAKTVNTNEAGRDEHLRGKDFFDTDKYPTITFKSKRVEKAKNDKLQMVGDLTMHGVTKEVALDVEGPTQAVKDSKGREHIGASANAKLNRKDFGIEYNSVLEAGGVTIGETVDITLDIELIKDDNKTSEKGVEKATEKAAK